MNTAGDRLAVVAESQEGVRADLLSGQTALFGYLMATNSKLSDFSPEWARTGFGEPASHYTLLNRAAGNSSAAPYRLLNTAAGVPDPPIILRVHDWCAAFVDWCVQQLLLNAPNSTSLTLAGRPKTASAWGLLQWGDKSNDCDVMTLADGAPARGDIAVFTFHHTGIITEPDKTGFQSVEGNTTRFKGGNQGFGVFKRRRSNSSLKGFIRLKPKFNAVGDFEFSSQMLNKA